MDHIKICRNGECFTATKGGSSPYYRLPTDTNFYDNGKTLRSLKKIGNDYYLFDGKNIITEYKFSIFIENNTEEMYDANFTCKKCGSGMDQKSDKIRCANANCRIVYSYN